MIIKYFKKHWIKSEMKNWYYFNSCINVMLTNSFTDSFDSFIKRFIRDYIDISIPDLLNNFLIILFQ